MPNTAVIHYILEEVNFDYKMLDFRSSFFNSAGSRPGDKGDPSHPDPLMGGRGGGGSLQKNFLGPLGLSLV